MEATHRVRNVRPKLRWAACGLVTIMWIGFLSHLIWSIFKIFWYRHMPPTEVSFKNAANEDVHYEGMPWMAFKLESFGEDFGPQFTKNKTSIHIKDREKRFTCWPLSESVCPGPNVLLATTARVNKPSQNNLMIVDMTQSEPHWSHGTPWVKVILHSNSTRPRFTFYSGEAQDLTDARATQNYDKMMRRLIGHAQGKLSESIPGCIRMYIDVEKGIVPKEGITCWGVPWQHCTQVHYTMVFSALTEEEPVSDDCESGQIIIQIILRSFIVRKVVPIGILQQLHSAFSDMGGSLALLTSVFFVFFVRQYTPTHDEDMSSALTFLGTHEEERPTFEEYEAMESASMENPLDEFEADE